MSSSRRNGMPFHIRDAPNDEVFSGETNPNGRLVKSNGRNTLI